jgi:hypothetical protein
MSGLETALVILISIWSLIFIIFLAVILIIFFSIKRLLGKMNRLVDEAEDIADKFNIPSKVVMASVMGFIAKNSFDGIKNLVSENFFKGKKSSK